jgi:hypothetical protein
MMEILAIGCMILCIVAIVLSLGVYMENRKIMPGKKKKEKKHPY